MKLFSSPLFLPTGCAFLAGILLVCVLCWACKRGILDSKNRVLLLSPIILIVFAILIFLAYILAPENFLTQFARPIQPIPFIMGLAATEALGSLLPILLKCTERKIHIEIPGGISEKQWKDLWEVPKGGDIVGHLERILYFIALLFDPLYIGGLLTFKIAAKWEAWKNIVQVPQRKLEEFPSELSYFIFRRKLGSKLLNRFLVGTFSNILFAVAGYGFFRWFLIMLDP